MMRYSVLGCILALAVQRSAAQMFTMNCGLLALSRMDPFFAEGEQSGHVHAISGSSGFDLETNADKLMNANCTSCPIKEDMSAYWVPNLYFRWANDTYSEVNFDLDNSGLRIYYFSRKGDDEETPQPFPAGLRMFGGDPRFRSFNGAREQQAVTFACYNDEDRPQTHSLPVDVDDCHSEAAGNWLRAQVYFPSCWNGEDLDSPDHASHMAYPDGDIGTSGGKCPASHPVRLTSLFYERFYDMTRWNGIHDQAWNTSQPFVFSNGDGTGYGFHGDFESGWDEEALGQAAEHCADTVSFENCEYLTPIPEDDFSQCKITPPFDENVGADGSLLESLPGDNPVAYDGPDYEDIVGDGRSTEDASGLGSSSSAEGSSMAGSSSEDEENLESLPEDDATVDLHTSGDPSGAGEWAAQRSRRRARSLR